MVYRLAKQYIGSKWALLAPALLSVNLLFFIETTFGRTHVYSTLFILLGVVQFLKTTPENTKKSMLKMGLLFGLGYMAHQDGAIFFALIFLFALLQFRQKALWISLFGHVSRHFIA